MTESFDNNPRVLNAEFISVSSELSIPLGTEAAEVSGQLVHAGTKDGIAGAEVVVTLGWIVTVPHIEVTDQQGLFSVKVPVHMLTEGAYPYEVDLPSEGQYHAISQHGQIRIGSESVDSVQAAAQKPEVAVPEEYKPLNNERLYEAAKEAVAEPEDIVREHYRGDRQPIDLYRGGFSPTSSLLDAVKRVLCDPAVSSGVSHLLREAAHHLEATKARLDAAQERDNAKDSAAHEAAKQAHDEATEREKEASKAFQRNVTAAVTKFASAFSGSNAVAATAEPCRGTVVVEFRQTDGTKTEFLSQDRLRKINLQIIDSNGNLAAGNGVVEHGAIRFENVEAGDVSIALQTEFLTEAAAISDKYEVRQGTGKFLPLDRKGVLRARGFFRGAKDGGPFLATVPKGEETTVRLTLQPKMAVVRCFSALQPEAGGCTSGKQYISKIAINAMRDGHLVECGSTNEAGCSPFELSPGWYTFSAPQDVVIDGCTYTLATSSPITAFVAAGQMCSDLVFQYKRKGNSISVSTFLSRPEVDDPKETVTEDLSGMSYLLLREGDGSFSAQMTATGTEHITFPGLQAGTYWLFFIPPSATGSKSIRPVYPIGGRLTLTLFNGQANPVSVRGHFKTVPKAKPATLQGFVRDDSGRPVAQQIVQAVNHSGYVVAAAVTNDSGTYSMLIYEAIDLQIVAGTKQSAVSRSELHKELQSLIAPAIPPDIEGVGAILQEPLLVSDL
jgi:hypothetical protein